MCLGNLMSTLNFLKYEILLFLKSNRVNQDVWHEDTYKLTHFQPALFGCWLHQTCQLSLGMDGEAVTCRLPDLGSNRKSNDLAVYPELLTAVCTRAEDGKVMASTWCLGLLHGETWALLRSGPFDHGRVLGTVQGGAFWTSGWFQCPSTRSSSRLMSGLN